MRWGRAVSSVVVLVASGGAVGLFAPAPALASCAGAAIVVGEDPTEAFGGDGEPVTLPAGRFTVSGQSFYTGECDDTSSGAGCSGPSGPGMEPVEDVDLVLEQGGSSFTLATADASADTFQVSWTVVLPSGVVPGPATLRARGAELPVIVP